MASIPNRKSFSDVGKLPSFTTALPGIAELLNKMVAKGDAKGPNNERTAFDGSKPAPVSIQDYLIRMCKYGYCSHEVFICMVIYLGRIRAKVGTTFTSCNIHRLLLTSFVVAAKLRDDTYYSNKYYASIGGVSLQDMNKMEQQFLKCTAWELHISKKEYDQYFAAMQVTSRKTSQPALREQPAATSAASSSTSEKRRSAGSASAPITSSPSNSKSSSLTHHLSSAMSPPYAGPSSQAQQHDPASSTASALQSRVSSSPSTSRTAQP